MLVKNVILGTLLLLGREDIANLLSENAELEGEAEQTVKTLMHCYNAVEDELARLYFPLTDEFNCKVQGGEVSYLSFPKTPVKIISVKSQNKAVKYRVLPTKLKTASGEVVIEYNYSPNKKSIDGQTEGSLPISERLLSYGIAAEFCLICGLVKDAESWESKYREEIYTLKSSMQKT